MAVGGNWLASVAVLMAVTGNVKALTSSFMAVGLHLVTVAL